MLNVNRYQSLTNGACMRQCVASHEKRAKGTDESCELSLP
jgi:hypothetical protein